MRAVGVKVLKNKLSEYVRLAAAGETVLVTEKDAVKLPADTPGVWVLPLDFQLPPETLAAVLAALRHDP